MLHRASMQYYNDYLKNKGYTVKYCEYKDNPNVKKSDNTMFDPIDNLKNKIKNIIESPNFIMTKIIMKNTERKQTNLCSIIFTCGVKIR